MSVTTEQPTKQQQREFWKWCGLRCSGPTGGFFWLEGEIVIDLHKKETSVTLSNLLKYALPRVDETGWNLRLDRSSGSWSVSHETGGQRNYCASSDDLALALFWGIWAIHEATRGERWCRYLAGYCYLEDCQNCQLIYG